MPAYNLLDLSTVVRSFGRGVVFYSDLWLPELGNPIDLNHLGDTEGDISIATNPELNGLTTPELTGPAKHEIDYTGEAPMVEVPLYLTDPALYAVISPSNSQHAGRSRVSAVAERTLVIFPERLFLEGSPGDAISAATLAVTAGVWTLGGVALTATQTALLGQSIWLWRGVFNRPPRTFHGGTGDARKQIETCSFEVMHHPDMPEGHHLYTIGDPSLASIDLDGAS